MLHISYPYLTVTERDLCLAPYLGGCLNEEVHGLEHQHQHHMLTVTTALIAIA